MPTDPNIGEYVPTEWHDYDVPAIDAAKLNKIEQAIKTSYSYLSSAISTSITSTFDADLVFSTEYGGVRTIRFKDAADTFNISILAKDGTDATYPNTVGLFDYNNAGGKYAWYYDAVTHTTFMGALDLTNNRIIHVATPVAGTDAATKDYVDSRGGTLDWVDSVKDMLNTPPSTPVDGDRYIVGASPTGVWVGHANQIAQYSSTQLAWIYPGTLSEGCTTWMEDENKFYTWNGTAWGGQDTYSSHNSLSGLQGGTTNEYYHLTSAQLSGLTGGSNTTLHSHDYSATFLGLHAKADDADKLDNMQPATAATPTTIAQRDASGDLYATTFHGALSGNVSGNVTGTLTGNVTGNVTGSSGSTTGNAATATKWQTARTITLSGDVSGSASGVDGSGDVSITTTVADDSHTHDTRYYTETESDARFTNVSKASGALPATIGWYRIAASPSGEDRLGGIFDIDWTVSSHHGRATVLANGNFAQKMNLVQLSYSCYGPGTGITKARIVYHPTYSGNYAYLEVFLASTDAVTLSAQLIDGKGWTLQTPAAGQVPAGYSVSELTLDEGIATNGLLRVQPYSSSAGAITVNTPWYQRANWLWNGAAYVNNTVEANLPTNATFDYINATGEYMYVGCDEPFYRLQLDVQTAGAGYTSVYEYWNGAWTAFTPDSGLLNFTADTTIAWSGLVDWTTKAFSASDPHNASPPSTTAYYWIRISTSTTPSTTAKIYAITPFVYTGKFLSFSRETGEVFSVSASGALVCNGCNFSNGAMTGVNAISISDPGGHEGINWAGGNLWDIFESPDDASNNSGDLQFFQNTTRRFTIRTTGVVDAPGGISTAAAITSTLATGTAPFTVASTTAVTNLNADMLDGHHADEFALASGAGYLPLDGSSAMTGQLQSNYSTGAPFSLNVAAANYTVTSLNADLLDGHHASDFALASGAGYLPLNGGALTGTLSTNSQIQSTYNAGAPFTVASSTVVTNLNADLVDGKHVGTTADSVLLLPTSARGDILFYNGTNWVKLAAGTSGYFLKTQSTTADPIWSNSFTGTFSSGSQITSTLADGTAPFVITSTTKVNNLNVDRVDDMHASSTYSAGTASIVSRDTSGNFNAGTITAALSGNASTASAWQTARTLTVSGAETGTVDIKGDAAMTLTLAVNHNHDSNYLKLTGGSLSGTLTFSNSATINMGSAKITSLHDPDDPQDAATKNYVDALAGGITWLNPIISKTVTAEPTSPTIGDRYIIPAGKTGTNWSSIAVNSIVQWTAGTPNYWAVTTPAKGNSVFCNSDSMTYNYNGTSWVQTSGQVSHQNLTNLQGGTTNQYYHLTSADYTTLRGGSSDASSLHNHASLYLGTSAKAADSDKLDNMQPATASTVSTIAQRDTSGDLTARRLISDVAQGTAPLQVTSTTKVANLNADLLDDRSADTASNVNTIAQRDASGNLTAKRLISDVAQGTAPLGVTSTTVVPNLNASLLEGHPASDFAPSSGAGYLPLSGGALTGTLSTNSQIQSSYNAGAPFTVASNTVVTNLNADTVDGAHAGTAANNVLKLDSNGKVPVANLPGGTGGTLDADTVDTHHAGTAAGNVLVLDGSGKVPNANLYTGSGNGIDADKLDGMHAASTNTVSSVVSRDGSGNFAAGTITASTLSAATAGTLFDTNGTMYNTVIDSRYSYGSFQWNDYSRNLIFDAHLKYTVAWNNTTGLLYQDSIWQADADDHFMTLDMSTVADPLIVTVSGFNWTTTDAGTIREFLTWHGSAAYSTVTFEIMDKNSAWHTLANEKTIGYMIVSQNTTAGGCSSLYPFTQMRVTMSGKTVTTGNRYIYAIGLWGARGPPFPYYARVNGGTFYGNSNWASGAPQVNGSNVWHPGNDGSGSGLDADLLDNMQPATASTASTIAQRDASGNLTAKQLVSDIADGTAPLTITSTTKVNNLNADTVDGIHASTTATANYLFPLGTGNKFPNSVLNTGSGNSLDADSVDGAHAGTSANNVLKLDSSGKVPVANLPTGAGSTLDADTVDTKHAGTTAGTVLVLPTSTQGDILYYNGTNWVNLGAGTSGKYLKTQGTSGNPVWDNTFSTASQITSSLADGTAPFSITSTTKVANLNVDRLDDMHTATASTATTVAARDASGNLTAKALISDVAQGTAPIQVTSTTKVANLNADKLDDMESATAATVSTIAARDSSGDLTARRLISGIADGTSPLSVTSTTVNTNLNADMIDGKHLTDLDSRYSSISKTSGTTTNAIGWYRIASSALGIANNSGIFDIDWVVSGQHGRASIIASTHYGENPNISQLAYSNFDGNISAINGITKARIVYHTTYTGNYAHVEVFLNNAVALPITVALLDGKGWTLTDPSTAGNIPGGYLSVELNFAEGLATNGAVTVNPYENADAIYVQQPTLYNDSVMLHLNGATSYNTACWYWNTSAYTNNTTESNSAGGSAFDFLTATSHYVYIGSFQPFYSLTTDIASPGNGYTLAFQYYNGSIWTSFTPSNDGTNAMTVDGVITWNYLPGWTSLAFSGSVPHNATPVDTTSRYWIRISTTTFTSKATINYMTGSIYAGKFIRALNHGSELFYVGSDGGLWTNGVITSAVATNTAPFTVASTTKVTNLNADTVDDKHASVANTNDYIVVRDGSGNITVSTVNASGVTSSGNIKTTGTAKVGVAGNGHTTFLSGSASQGSDVTYTLPATGASVGTGGDGNTALLAISAADALSWLRYSTGNDFWTIVERDGTGNFSAGTITAALNGNASTATSATQIQGVDGMTVMESLRANVTITGGGTVTHSSGGYLKWTERFIVISNGRGANFGTSGYFDIACPGTGVAITGAGGSAGATTTVDGIPLTGWQALYYILPIGSGSGSGNSNFRIVDYGSDLNVPSTWVLLAVRNSDTTPRIKLAPYGVILQAGQSFDTYKGAWHQGNDGTGSGLDADKLDGHEHDDFVHEAGDEMSGALTMANNIRIYGKDTGGTQRELAFMSSGNVAYLGDKNQPTLIQGSGNLTHYNGTDNFTIWDSGNDGIGSGLDADRVDGMHASSTYVKGTASVVSRDTLGDFAANTATIDGHIVMSGNTEVKSVTLAIEPTDPAPEDGDTYIIPATGATGTNWESIPVKSLVTWDDVEGLWEVTTPVEGMSVICLSDGLTYKYVDSTWAQTAGYTTTIRGSGQTEDIMYTMPAVKAGSKTYLVNRGDQYGTLEWSDMSSTEAVAYEAVKVSYSAVGLNTMYTDAYKYATITVENGPIRVRVDGIDSPSNANGHLIYDGDMLYLDSQHDLKKFKAIAADGNNPGWLRVTYSNVL